MGKPVNLEGMKEDAASIQWRKEFEQLTERSRQRAAQVDVKTYLQFLTFMSRLNPTTARRPLTPYPNARL